MLYTANASNLLTCLQKLRLPNLTLPRNAQGLSSRLASAKFREFQFLATDTPGVDALRRKEASRPIGFFRPAGMLTESTSVLVIDSDSEGNCE